MTGIPDELVWEALLGFGFGPGELECEAEMRAALEAVGLPALLERVDELQEMVRARNLALDSLGTAVHEATDTPTAEGENYELAMERLSNLRGRVVEAETAYAIASRLHGEQHGRAEQLAAANATLLERVEAAEREVTPVLIDLDALLMGWDDGERMGWHEEFCWLEAHHQSALDGLLTSIQETGIQEPVLIGDDGRVWDGHHRIYAASKLGIQKVPVVFAQHAALTAERDALAAKVADAGERIALAIESSYRGNTGYYAAAMNDAAAIARTALTEGTEG